MSNEGERVVATNRKAFHDYHITDRAEAGIALLGTEIKSIREGGLSLRDAYVEVRDGELFMTGGRIAPYSHGSVNNHEERRDRKLLMRKREIEKWGGRATDRGLTIVPLKAYLKKGRVKIEIGMAKGKRQYDKRDALRKKDQAREAQQAVRAQQRRHS